MVDENDLLSGLVDQPERGGVGAERVDPAGEKDADRPGGLDLSREGAGDLVQAPRPFASADEIGDVAGDHRGADDLAGLIANR